MAAGLRQKEIASPTSLGLDGPCIAAEIIGSLWQGITYIRKGFEWLDYWQTDTKFVRLEDEKDPHSIVNCFYTGLFS